MSETPEDIGRRISRSGSGRVRNIANAIRAERAVIETCVSTLKTLRQNYRNDSEHARLIDAALKAAEGR